MAVEGQLSIIIAVLAALAWGISPTFFKRTTKLIGPIHFKNLDKKRLRELFRTSTLYLAFGLKVLGGALMLISLSVAKVSVVGPLMALVYPSQAISARVINGELISRSDMLSIGGVTLGVAVIVGYGVGI